MWFINQPEARARSHAFAARRLTSPPANRSLRMDRMINDETSVRNLHRGVDSSAAREKKFRRVINKNKHTQEPRRS